MESTHSWLSELKLRATYGTQGNEDLANYYPYTDQYTVTISEGKLGTEIYYYGNPDLTWEKQKTFDLGLAESSIRTIWYDKCGMYDQLRPVLQEFFRNLYRK